MLATRGNLTEVPLAQAKPTDLLTATEVAELCGMTHGRVCQLLQKGLMKGHKMLGIIWQVERREAEKFAQRPEGPGRPRIGD
jgi:hypothetical protein